MDNETKRGAKNLLDEADIGSGEKTPGQRETERLIEEIGNDKNNSALRQNKKSQQENANNAAPQKNR